MFAVNTHRPHEKVKRLIMIAEISVCSTLNGRLRGKKSSQLTLSWIVMLENVN